MGISITYSAITVDNVVVTFEDIYQYAVTNNQTNYISKLGNSYLITNDLIITNNATVFDTNKFITINGDLLQIHKGSSLSLGTKRVDGSTLDGCTLNMPSVKLAYGFGCTNTTDSGDFFAYGSTINIFGFWGFFSGANHVEVIDCFVDGFGRIEGVNSILKNIIFKKSHGRFGVLSPKGTINTLEKLYSYDSTVYYDAATSNNVSCALYHNPGYAPDLDIYYGEYNGYNELAYIEPTSVKHTLRLRGSIVNNGYTIHRVNANVDFYHQYRFNPMVLKTDSSTAVGVSVIVSDVDGVEVFNSTTDQTGNVDGWITYYEDIVGSTPRIKTPHTITMTDGTITNSEKIYMDKNYEMFPLYFIDTTATTTTGGTTVDYTIIQGMLDTLKNDVCVCSDTTAILTAVNANSTKLDTAASDLRAIKVAQGVNLAETETTIITASGTRVVL